MIDFLIKRTKYQLHLIILFHSLIFLSSFVAKSIISWKLPSSSICNINSNQKVNFPFFFFSFWELVRGWDIPQKIEGWGIPLFLSDSSIRVRILKSVSFSKRFEGLENSEKSWAVAWGLNVGHRGWPNQDKSVFASLFP